MGDPKTVLEGCVKYRDKKKWKARWAVVSKLSPVADCLHLQLYRDSKERCKNGPTKASLSLEGFLGLETGFTLDKESNTMALICSELVVVLAFDSRELLIQWQVKIRSNLAEEQQFLVQIAHIPTKSKLPCGPARLHLQDYTFCLVAGVPPRLLGTWPIKELRRFGVIEGKFCFEGGSLCGKGEGLHILLTNQSEELAQSMDLASKGKLLSKRKNLSRKNSVLETSSRTPLHKPIRHCSEKCSATDLNRPLLSSGSESSTCDACSEILRSSDPLVGCDDPYHSSVTKAASSCRIHYRWPSCMSRWGQSSTVTASDVESMDTVSVTLSDYQGAAHSTVSSKGNSHGSSLLCLCDGQGTWPFNHCAKCGRQFYSRSSLGHQNGMNGNRRPISPDQQSTERNSFSPQWTMNVALPSPAATTETFSNARKDSPYQLMQPSYDRTSLCSHTSRSSSTSTASSSGSEYSVPRNYLEALYDKPKALHIKNGGCSNHKNGTFNGSAAPTHQVQIDQCNSNRGHLKPDNTIVCPCHEPVNERMVSQEDQIVRPSCSCWNQLSLSMRSEKEVRVTLVPNNRSASANPSPSSSPKKVQYNSNASTVRTNTVSIAAMSQSMACTCHKSAVNPNAYYAVPKMALSGMYLKDKQMSSGQITSAPHLTESPFHPLPSEDYDVPKKFADMRVGGEMHLKSAMACKCKNLSRSAPQKSLDIYNSQQRFDPPSENSLQMCTCQRVMLWAESFVPCLGGQSSATESGWQYEKASIHSQGPRFHGTICCEPHRTSEVILVNGKPKHVLHAQNVKGQNADPPDSTHANHCKDAENSDVSAVAPVNKKSTSGSDLACNYVNIEFSNDSSSENAKLVVKDDSAINYANLDFSQTVPLYENSNSVLNRLDSNTENHVPSPERPPLPPRGQSSVNKANELHRTNISELSEQKSQSHYVHSDITKHPHINGGAYELMCFEKQHTGSLDDDYLMMQPIYPRNSESRTKKLSEEKESVSSIDESDLCQSESPKMKEDRNDLPLRPFMPLSYPHSESSELETNSVLKSVLSHSDPISKRYLLINEEMEIRSARSNSLSELKKIVLLRKRSSSVDGKSNISVLDMSVKSNPASPLGSPRTYVQRKNSLFSKLNLRSKEKSMSTNEIIPRVVLPSTNIVLTNNRKNTLHRSADCLKLNEECINSDDDLSTDVYETSQKEGTSMKRSSSVPCRSATPGNFANPPKNAILVIPEMNDLNKESSITVVEVDHMEKGQSHLQRKYSLDSQENPKKQILLHAQRSICDNFKPITLNERYDSHGIRCHTSHSIDEASILDPYKSTTSSSSSDTSDFIDSLTHCSRSSSSGSTSSSDYMRSEDIYPQRPNAKLNASKNSVNVFGPAVIAHRTKLRSHDDSEYSSHCENHAINSKTTFFPTPNQCKSDNLELSKSLSKCSDTYSSKISEPIAISNGSETNVAGKTVNGSRTRSDSKSPNSSTSSLSTSPSTTDYSSSSSGNCGILGTNVVGTHTTAQQLYKQSNTSQPISNRAPTKTKLEPRSSYGSISDTSSSLTDCNIDT